MIVRKLFAVSLLGALIGSLLTPFGACAQAPPEAGEDWFDFAPAVDPFTDDALLDLRSLNQTGRAGSEGWIVARGNDLVCARTGRRVRFSSVNGPVPWSGSWGTSEDRAYLAKRLGKLGVNMIRLGPVRGSHKITNDNLAGLQEMVSRCADEGIYTMLGFFFPLEVRVEGLEGWEGKGVPSLAFFHPQVKSAYVGWLKKMMTTPNPHTGKTLAEDQAVASIILMNEDNLFFHTYRPSEWPEATRAILERQFADWLVARYGSMDKALASWGPEARLAEDKPELNRVYVYDAYRFMDADWARQGRDRERAADTLRFLVHLQRGFFAEMRQELRSWGYGGTTIATNWKTTNPRQLDALEKYANMAADVMDRHAYFSALRRPGGPGWKTNPGDVYVSRSQLTAPASMMNGIQYAGYPQVLSEHLYPAPNRFRTEMVWIGAHYGAMTGHDAFSINEIHTADWPRKPAKRFDAYTPVNLGQFPAASMVYRLGMIQEAEPVYVVTRTPEQLYAMTPSPIWDEMNLDDFRAVEIQGNSGSEAKAMDPMAWFVGPVQFRIADKAAAVEAVDIGPYVDRGAGVVTSRTRELRWDYTHGVLTSHAPRAQSACGFLSRVGPIDLPDVRIDLSNEYAAVWLVSMDGKPLASSEKILLQVMTEQRIGGSEFVAATYTDPKTGQARPAVRIARLGNGPMQIRNVRGTVSLRRGDAGEFEAVALDQNGYVRETLPASPDAIELLPDCVYYILRKK
jgi:hypothetical protein